MTVEPAGGASRGSSAADSPVVQAPDDPGGSLVASEVSKRFGAQVALDGVSLVVRRGCVHALLGENGAGKSTIISILNGRLAADAGAVAIDGEQLQGDHPERFAARGVATVYQDLMLVPSMTGLENIALATGRSASANLRREVLELQESSGFHAALDEVVDSLELAERQRIELLRALILRPNFLLLDEPTTFLPPTAIDGFIRQVRDLATRGLGILFITHRLAEARAVADEMTIIRRGRIVSRYDSDIPSDETLAIEIVGRPIDVLAQEVAEFGAVALRVRDLEVLSPAGARVVDSCSFDVRAGEILGITGVDGNGQLELLEAIAGHRPSAGGSVELDDVDVTHQPYRIRASLGLQYVSGERKRHGILPSLTVGDHFRYVHGSKMKSGLQALLHRHEISPADPEHRADQLSGGNQQKMILARALYSRAEVLVLAYPTQGLDVLACDQVRRLLLAQASRGTAIVVATSDLDEALAICHRIVVMNRGSIVGLQSRDEFDPGKLAEWFTSSSRGANLGDRTIDR